MKEEKEEYKCVNIFLIIVCFKNHKESNNYKEFNIKIKYNKL